MKSLVTLILYLASSKPLDTDADGIPNCIDTDDDGDGYVG